MGLLNLSLVVVSLFLTGAVNAAPEAKYVKLKKIPALSLQGEAPSDLAVGFTIDKGMHVQANPASLPNLIATTLTFEPNADLELGAVVYPAGKPHRVQSFQGDIATYVGAATITVPVKKAAGSTAKKTTLVGKLRYQACSEITCFFPMTLPINVPVNLK